MFTTNVGSVDRMARIIIGLVLLAVAYFYQTGVGMWIVGIVGVVLIGTALMRTCPAYSLLGMSTCKLEKK
ncbi:MAG: DUF2892 domain-containing protein [Hyphomicrobiales bacterium]|nr:DUF2892 domain-containing protein [Hyphomicrobiales bacterium]